ncbi:MAG: hypothetical protein FWG98_13170 [Candidatus Cloacimonetes bacterium]|nr:hypothetical protein [Candidatus Cloacimonadota bacterium]
MLDSQISISLEEFFLFRNYVHQEYGIALKDEEITQIGSRLTRLMLESKSTNFKDFYLKAKNDATNKLKDGIIDTITSVETDWFRDTNPWLFFRDKILPNFIDDLRNKRRENVVIWSAGASTGQEPYSIAMLVDETVKKEPKINSKQFFILATDISPSSLYIANSGRYSEISMKNEMLKAYKSKYFEKTDKIYEIKNEIKKMIYFMKFNLLNNMDDLPTFDVIFCRNVATHFSLDMKIKLYEKLAEKLDSKGMLFIGKDESLNSYSNDFERFEYQESSFYRLRKIDV